MIQSNEMVTDTAASREIQQTVVTPVAQTPSGGAEVFDIEVTAEQAMAIELIAAGKSVSAVATAVGVDRSTLYRWRTEDEDFMAALCRWRTQAQQSARDRLMAMTEAANEAIAKSVTDGDARLGYKILAAMGCMKPARIERQTQEPGDRTELHDQFQQVARTMTAEQRSRAAEILALGVRTDNERLARERVAAQTGGETGAQGQSSSDGGQG